MAFWRARWGCHRAKSSVWHFEEPNGVSQSKKLCYSFWLLKKPRSRKSHRFEEIRVPQVLMSKQKRPEPQMPVIGRWHKRNKRLASKDAKRTSKFKQTNKQTEGRTFQKTSQGLCFLSVLKWKPAKLYSNTPQWHQDREGLKVFWPSCFWSEKLWLILLSWGNWPAPASIH